jgi:hypothetical protein
MLAESPWQYDKKDARDVNVGAQSHRWGADCSDQCIGAVQLRPFQARTGQYGRTRAARLWSLALSIRSHHLDFAAPRVCNSKLVFMVDIHKQTKRYVASDQRENHNLALSYCM